MVPYLIRQPSSTTCGQCVVAMILNCDVKHVIKNVIGHNGITSDEEICNALNIKCVFTDGPPSNNVVAIQKHGHPKRDDLEHWTLMWHGNLLDPACIGNKIWPVKKHIVLVGLG